jgi:hypothetical protein
LWTLLAAVDPGRSSLASAVTATTGAAFDEAKALTRRLEAPCIRWVMAEHSGLPVSASISSGPAAAGSDSTSGSAGSSMATTGRRAASRPGGRVRPAPVRRRASAPRSSVRSGRSGRRTSRCRAGEVPLDCRGVRGRRGGQGHHPSGRQPLRATGAYTSARRPAYPAAGRDDHGRGSAAVTRVHTAEAQQPERPLQPPAGASTAASYSASPQAQRFLQRWWP